MNEAFQMRIFKFQEANKQNKTKQKMKWFYDHQATERVFSPRYSVNVVNIIQKFRINTKTKLSGAKFITCFRRKHFLLPR
jgi:hypothetical protein